MATEETRDAMAHGGMTTKIDRGARIARLALGAGVIAWTCFIPQGCGGGGGENAPPASPAAPPPAGPPAAVDMPAAGAPESSGPASPDVQRGIAAIKANDFKAAKAALERALEKNPKDGTASYYLGVSLENLGDKAGAEKRYKDAIALAPDVVEASINLGALYLDENRADDAIAVTRAALARRSNDPALHANLAFALRAKGDKEGAAAEYQKAVQAMGDNAELRMGYAEVLLELGRKEQAATELKQALHAAGSNRALLASIGRLLGAAGGYADCIAAFDRAIASGDHPELRVHRGVCRHELKDEAGARADYEAALKLDSKFPPAHYYLGESLLDSGKKAEALKELDAAATAAPGSEIGKRARERADEVRRAGKKK